MVYRNNHYWMYSKHSIENALLNPNRKVFEFLLEDRLFDFYQSFLKKHNINKKKINIKITSKSIILKKIGKLAKYQGIALSVEKLSLKNNFLLKNGISDNNFILIIDQLNDPLNFGSILRVSYAFGIKNIIVQDRYMPKENGYIASVASGSLDKLNIFKITNIVNIINYLKKNDWWIAGLESKKLKNCYKIRSQRHKTDKLVLIIGSESNGLRNLTRNNCDILYRIPIKNEELDSINVVQATSIALYELTKYNL